MNSPKKYPNVVGSWKLTWVARFLKNPFLTSGVFFTSTFIPWLGIVLTGAEKENYRYYLLGGAILLVVFSGVVIPYIVRLYRYGIISKEIRKSVNRLNISSETLLIGAGGGSYTAIGMLLKAWEEEGRGIPPDSLCVSMACKTENERDFYPSLNEIKSCVNNRHILIVLAEIGTGSTAKSLLTWAKSIESVKEVDLFSLIISETAAQSGDWEKVFTLGIINRKDNVKHSVLPWVSTTDEF
jgi:hypoxanthine-guanine phosphoribosyltransferase